MPTKQDRAARVQAQAEAKATRSARAEAVTLRSCYGCKFLQECRTLVDTLSAIDPYCFADSKYFHRYVAEYGRPVDTSVDVLEMRETMTLDEIAASLGVTRQRVHAMVKAASRKQPRQMEMALEVAGEAAA